MTYDTIRNHHEEVSQFRSTYLRITNAFSAKYAKAPRLITMNTAVAIAAATAKSAPRW
ncbi:hypothetical protein [Brevibacillus agri]|uniref:hypothetical protein n=1 Tax=Brevibacillus agri TaxID=51101 RepID=UPI001EE5D62E|nr:hypothetical protein [Brevibacillus agri]MCG5252580.1 hypothetical protein [Brevibacillus agri]